MSAAAEEGKSKKVGVKATFNLPDGTTVVREFDASNTAIPKLGETTAEATTIGAYDYTGKHDQGALPAPREGGPFAQLIGCVLATKYFSNEYLTDVIKKEKCCRRSSEDDSTTNGQVLKKPREDVVDKIPSGQ